MMEVRIAKGIEVAMMTVLRQLPRKVRIMKAVKHAAISVSLTTPLIANAVHTQQVPFPGYGTRPGFVVNNDNLLLRTYSGDLGGKNGYTTDAQETYANAAMREGHRVALVMLRGTNRLAGKWQTLRRPYSFMFSDELRRDLEGLGHRWSERHSAYHQRRPHPPTDSLFTCRRRRVADR